MAAHIGEAVVLAKGGAGRGGGELFERALLGFKGFRGPSAGLAVNYGSPLDRGKFFERFHFVLLAVSELLGGTDGASVDPELNFKRNRIFGVFFEESAKSFAANDSVPGPLGNSI